MSRPAASTPSAVAKCSRCCGSCATSARSRSSSSATTPWRPTTPTACSRCATGGSSIIDPTQSRSRTARDDRSARGEMRPSNLLHLYRIRLRARLLQECFAIVGIAAGVALLFASQIASHSLSSSVAQLSRGIVGDATLQLRSRDAQGFDERLLARVRRTPGVRVAVPLLEANANVVGPRGSRSVELVGADESPARLADQIGVTGFGAEADLEVGGHTGRAPLYSRLSAAQIGPLIDAPIVVAPLPYAQELAGLRGHLTRILVEPRPGDKPAVRAALTRLAGGTLDVEPTSYDEGLFAEAAAVSNQSTVLFAVISALGGFLFAFNATLLTVPQRRRL